MRVICVAGARPNYMKVKPVMDALEERGAQVILVHTGQHYDPAMSDVFFADLGIRRPDHFLGAGSGTHAVQTCRVMTAFEPLAAELTPDVVVVVGDVNSTLACALVTAKLGAPLAHVEAGLRSNDRSMPEEINRIVTDRVSDYLFAPSAEAVANLRAEGYGHEQIHLVGNVMVDTLLANADRAAAGGTLAGLGLRPGQYGLVTLHRPANVDDPAVLGALLPALAEISRSCPLVLPAHPRAAGQLHSAGLPAGVRIIPPAGYLDFIALEASARLVLTDSGGVQEETTVLGVPCLTLRDSTERPITLTEGTNQLVGRNPDLIVRAAREVLAAPPPRPGKPAMWDGQAGRRIAAALVAGYDARSQRVASLPCERRSSTRDRYQAHIPRLRPAGSAAEVGVAGLAVIGSGISLVVAETGAVYIEGLNDLYTNSVGTFTAWVAALVLVVATLVALAHKGRHAGWFHPLSLPFATLAVMSLGAALWVYFTHEAVGLLYDAGYQPANESTLAVAVSVTACEALTLVIVGYMVGVGAALALTKQAKPAVIEQRRPMFGYRDMRRAGLMLMVLGAVSQLAVAALTRGSTYGANQLHYSLASILGTSAATALFVGLILVTLTASHTTKPSHLRNLLRGSEWAALFLYISAVAVTGDRAGLIAPIVYFAWVYSTQVRVIALKWIVAGLLVALVGGTVISNYRQGDGLSPGSPNVVIQNAVGDVSSSAWLTQQTVINVPSMARYMHGSTYLAAVESQLPGPVARAVGAPTRTASAVFRNIIGFSDPNQGFAESYPSEAYLNFGLVGCLGAGLFLGALMGWAWRKLRVTATRPRDLLYPVLLAGLVYGFRSDALTQIKQVLYPMLAIWALMRWYRLRSTATADFPQRFGPIGRQEAVTGTEGLMRTDT